MLKNKAWQYIKLTFLRLLFVGITLFFLSFSALVVAIQFPNVQTKMVAYVTQAFSDAVRFPVEIEKVNISWFDTMELRGVAIKDKNRVNMIYIDKLTANFFLPKIFISNKILVKKVTLDSVLVNVQYDSTIKKVNIDAFIYAINQLGKSSSPDTVKSPSIAFQVKTVLLKRGKFIFEDPTEKRLGSKRFDVFHFGFDNISLQADSFKIREDTLQFKIKNLNAQERYTQLKINKLNTFFRLTCSALSLLDLDASIGKSHVKDKMVFHFNDIIELSYFNDSVYTEASFNQSQFTSQDLAFFAPDMAKINQKFTLSGRFRGKVKDFTLDKLNLTFGEKSYLKGRVAFKGLPESINPQMSLYFDDSYFEHQDIEPYLDSQMVDLSRQIGKSKFEASFLGTPKAFTLAGDFDTNLGKIEGEADFKISDAANSSYEASVKVNQFKLGEFTKIKSFGMITGRGRVAGKGFGIENANLKVEAEVAKVNLLKYNYKNAVVNAKFLNKVFIGDLYVNDSNLVMNAHADIELNKKPEILVVDAKILKSNPRLLLLSNEILNFSSDVKMNCSDLSKEGIWGNVELRNTILRSKTHYLDVKQLSASCVKQNDKRVFKLKSDVFDATVEGYYSFYALADDFLYTYQSVENALRKKYNYSESNWVQTLKPNYKGNTDISYQIISQKNSSNFFKTFLPNLSIPEATEAYGVFSCKDSISFLVNSKPKSLSYETYKFNENSLTFYYQQAINSDYKYAFLDAQSKSVFDSNKKLTDQASLHASWYGDSIWVENKIKPNEKINEIAINSVITLHQDTLRGRISALAFDLLGKKWNIDSLNHMELVWGKALKLDNFNLYEKLQRLNINGTISKENNSRLNFDIDKLDISPINDWLSTNFTGKLSGKGDLTDPLGKMMLKGDLQVENLKLDTIHVGDIAISSKWDAETDKILINAELSHTQNKDLIIDGNIKWVDEYALLDLNCKFNQTKLNIIEPFLKRVLSDLQGNLTGNILLRGTSSDLSTNGILQLNQGSFTVSYLNTNYKYNGNIEVKNGFFGLKNAKVIDGNDQDVVLNGGITHKNFDKWAIDLEGKFKETLILNTTEASNNSYYGVAFASGDFDIKGPIDKLEINANIKSEPGTYLYLPLNSFEGVKQKDYISFKSNKKTSKSDQTCSDNPFEVVGEKNTNSIDLSKLLINLNFEMNENAYCEIIFDKKAGDIIRGVGNGNVSLNVDSKGDISMFGDYTFKKGAYNFTMLNIINKAFTINEGSKISWNGLPYDGILNISAGYRQNVSALPLLQLSEQEQQNPEYQRRYPTTVNLLLTGALMRPEIKYKIKIDDYPIKITNLIRGQITYIESNDQELNKQVFSLMVLKSFATLDNSIISNQATGAVAGSVSELFSNQLNQWLSSVDENFSIDFDINGLDANSLRNMRVRLSYTMLDGRLRLSRDGAFTNTQNQTTAYSVVGEWTLEYLLDKEGIFRVKVFNRNDPNAGLTAADRNSNPISGGFSLMYTKSFDNFEELIKQKEKQESNKEPKLISKEAIKKEEEEERK